MVNPEGQAPMPWDEEGLSLVEMRKRYLAYHDITEEDAARALAKRRLQEAAQRRVHRKRPWRFPWFWLKRAWLRLVLRSERA